MTLSRRFFSTSYLCLIFSAFFYSRNKSFEKCVCMCVWIKFDFKPGKLSLRISNDLADAKVLICLLWQHHSCCNFVYCLSFGIIFLCYWLHLNFFRFEDSVTCGLQKTESQMKKNKHFWHNILFQFIKEVKAAKETFKICNTYGENWIGKVWKEIVYLF